MVKKAVLAGMIAGLIVALVGCGDAQTEETVAEAEVEEIQAENRLEEIQQLGELKIGISADYAPFSFVDEDASGEEQYAGSDIELGKYIAKQMEVEPVFCEMEFDECLDAVRDGDVDLVLLGMLPKPERRSKMTFTDAYYKPGKQVLVVRKSSEEERDGASGEKKEEPDGKSWEKEDEVSRESGQDEGEAYPLADDFAGKTVAAQYGTLQAQLVIEQLPESYMELTDTAEEGIAMVEAGLADAVVLDDTGIADLLKKHPKLKLYSAAFEYTPEEIVGGVVRSEPELLEEVNGILAEVVTEKLYLIWLDEANQQAASQNQKGKSIPATSRQGYYSASPAADSEQ